MPVPSWRAVWHGLLVSVAGLALTLGVLIGVQHLQSWSDAARTTQSETDSKAVIQPYANFGDLDRPTGVIYRGRPFYVRYAFVRDEECYFDNTVTVQNYATRLIMPIEVSRNWAKAGVNDWNDRLELPADFPLGRVHLVKSVVNHCPSGTILMHIFDVAVDVEDPPTAR